MRLRLLLAAATVSSALACASRGRPEVTTGAPPATPGAPPPAPQQPPRASDGVRLGPSALRYVLHQQIHVEQQFQGQTQTIDRAIRLFLAATISGPADSVGHPLTFTIDSIVPDSGTTIPQVMNLGAARGLRYTGRLTPRGEFRDLTPSDSARAQAFAQIAGAFVRNFYPRLPAAGLTLGADWTDTLTSTDRTVVEVTSKSVHHARATAWEDRGGVRCLRLEVNAAYTVAGSGEQGGQLLEVAGSGTRSSVQFLAVDGRYLGGEFTDSSAIVVTLPIQSATVPVRQVSHYTVAVRP
jgi:hypothetical protein